MINNQADKAAILQKVSIIIVTYNAANNLQNCLDSIYKQTYPAIELVIIDGKSTDGTVEIIKQNQDKIHFWISEKDNGIYDAMNKGVKHANGEWIYFIGSDDELASGFSDMCHELTDTTAIYYANVFAEGAKRNGPLTRYQFAKTGPYHQAIIYPKSVFDRYRFDTKFRISADFALTLELCGDKSYHWAYRDHILANFNHEGTSGLNIDKPFQKAKSRLIFKYLGFKIWLRHRIYKLKHPNNPRA